MPITEEQMLQIAQQKGIDVSKYQQQAQQPQQPQIPQGRPQGTLITDLLDKINPKLTNSLIGAGEGWQGGGKTASSTGADLNKLYAEESIKKQFKDPNYVVSYDQNGQPVFTQAPGDIKNAPFYSSPMGGQYYEAKTGQAEAQGMQAQTETGLMQKFQQDLDSGKPITPGTTQQAGPYNIPLNPKLDADQAAAVSSSQVFTPQVENIAKEVKGGIFGPENTGMMGDIKRTARQVATDSGIPLLTFGDPKLQAVQGELNSIRRYAFGEGGKNLTGTEKQIVYALLNTTGKNDDQIISDHKKALATIQSKSNIALGGMNAAMQGQPQQGQVGNPNDFSSMSDEELQRIASGGQ